MSYPKWLGYEEVMPSLVEDDINRFKQAKRRKRNCTILVAAIITIIFLIVASITVKRHSRDNQVKNSNIKPNKVSGSSGSKWLMQALTEPLGAAQLTHSNLKPLTGLEQSAVQRGLPNVRNLRLLFLNHHFGTSSEMKAVVSTIARRNNITITTKESGGIHDHVKSLHSNKEASDAYWEKAKQEECNPDLFDMIIVGDTLSLIRPHIQNGCKLPIIATLTTRYDWAHETDEGWKKLIGNASYASNLRIYPNNLIEAWYAMKKGVDIQMYEYLPSSGIPSLNWGEALDSIHSVVKQPSDNELVIPDSVRIKACLSSQLDQRNIKYTGYARNQYGGPLGLTNRVVVHFPYQSNTMGLFENLHQQVIYVLPTIRLYKEMYATCQAKVESVPAEWLSEQDYERYIDWWRQDLQHLFYYFDSFEELREGSPLRQRIISEADSKRIQIAEFMVRQKEYVLRKWEDAWFGQWLSP
ncbi:uncharacterized protein FA14DRAFT_220 [Meira miltonrushii]|uniref:Uncharacterized protein n=1 Tax=Meira miltonrushii TaxID=1280837 RepID=A0A316VJF5_9BASI|nr:uncharacterized protein FA14DRAFT_220 [Meira miltonrushii]PWN36433.1 hypothetical protein FA14DRAFT_220 [Meira miltonrushii]